MDGWMVTKYQRLSKSTCGVNKKPKTKMKPKHILLKVNTKEISWDPALLLARNSSIAVLKFKIELKSAMVKMMKMCACLIANGNLDNHGVMMIIAYVINIRTSQ